MAAPLVSPGERVDILVVDDRPENLIVLESILTELGENVICAHSGEEALQKVLAHDFAAILLDVNMPGMDGYETAGLIRRRRQSAHVPILFITAYADELHETRGYSLGAVDYILSPVVPDILRTKVRVFVQLFRMAQEAKRHADQRVALAREQAAREAAERMASTLRDSEERVRLAFEAAQMRWWDEDLAATGGAPWNPEALLARTHSADRSLLEQCVRDALATRQPFRCEVRAAQGDGQTRWSLIAGRVFCSERGHPVRLAGIDLDITDRKRAEEALQEAGRRKDEFLSMLAHELRNPLAPLRSAVEILHVEGLTSQTTVGVAGMIERSVGQLVRLVDDLLDVSRISSGKIHLQVERVDMAAVVQQAMEISRPLLEARQHQLGVELPPEPVHVSGDFVRLTQVVANLLNNAAKYTPEAGRITLTLARQNEEAVVRVRDSGIGLTPDLLESVFDLFTQADRTLDRSDGGLGIGLTLVRRLTEMHGGRVEASSAGLGQGSEFVVRIPSVIVPTFSSLPAWGTAAAAGTPPAAAPRRVVIVDDNVDAAESLALLLRLAGHEVRTAHSGQTGIDAVRRFRPEVVFLDIGLPGMDGHEVARRLRSEPALAPLVLVAVSGYGRSEDRRRSAAAGFDEHLVKPVDRGAIARILAARESERPGAGAPTVMERAPTTG